ncbi:hypothetical protein QBC38DRAFT_462039 [Podospora fimiseda]|uniref:Uncharacterized protein n=1 Tax=Podospora fimiseda TaxID=252190 RepID=A0AAN6YKE8_9PEZI|nr:hypothetical protein QBC38DRAFT_462039 [Podospora fimiseda]
MLAIALVPTALALPGVKTASPSALLTPEVFKVSTFLPLDTVAWSAPEKKSNATGGVEKRQYGTSSVFYCRNAHWGTPCRTVTGSVPGTCYNTLPEWNNVISSLRNLNRDHTCCRWYDNTGCTGAYYQTEEDDDLGDGDGSWNDRISSYRCVNIEYAWWTGWPLPYCDW